MFSLQLVATPGVRAGCLDLRGEQTRACLLIMRRRMDVKTSMYAGILQRDNAILSQNSVQ